MVRKTYTRQSSWNSTYKHRSSVYLHRTGHFAADKPIFQEVVAPKASVVAMPVTDEELYVLPPKQPTPDVILRTDLMQKQRTRVVL